MASEMETKTAAIQNTLSNRRQFVENVINRMANSSDASEVTITFKQTYRNNNTNYEIIAFMRKYFRFLPLNLKEIILLPEYGDNKNLHFHGIIRGKASSVSELKGFLNRRFGRCTIATIRRPENYIKYLLKEQEDIILEDDFIYNDYIGVIYI